MRSIPMLMLSFFVNLSAAEKAVVRPETRQPTLLRVELEDKGQGMTRMDFRLRDGEVTAGCVVSAPRESRQPERVRKSVKSGRRATALLLDGLQCDGKRLRGTAVVASPFLWNPGARYELDVTLGATPTGTFKTSIGKKRKRRTLTGAVSGAVLRGPTLAAWRERHAIAPAGEWRNWKGPTYDNRAGDTGVELVDDLTQARVLWMSEYRLLGGGDGAGHNDPNATGRADYNGVLVADNKVYLSLAIGNPDAPLIPKLAKRSEERSTKHWRRLPPIEGRNALQQRLVRHACSWVTDDIMLCLDATTGETLWETTFPLRGVSADLGGKGKGGLWSVGTVHDGRWYVIGSTWRVYCLDTTTGKCLWETALDAGRVKAFEKRLADFQATGGKSEVGKRQTYLLDQVQFSPLLIDGVFVCPAGGDGLVGLDARNGQKLWHAKNARKGRWSPVRWTHQGRHYIFTGLTCLEPGTGKELWRITDWPEGRLEGDGVIVDDVVFACLSRKENRKTVAEFCGYRLSANGAKRIWSRLSDTRKDRTHGVVHEITRACAIAGDPTRGIFAFKGSHGSWLTIDVATGKTLSQVPYGNKFWGTMTLYKNHLFDGYERLCLIDDDKRLHPKGQLNTIKHTCISPVLADGRLFCYEPQGIVCYDLRKP